ncbi:MAG TPA: hypothetical protein ENI20_14955 [Bacteroides sp.]|nr:hypothetical protein [Bacteroides sp.]
MDVRELIRDKSKRKRVLFLLSAIFVLLISFGIIGYPTFRILLTDFLEAYLLLIERIANRLLHLFGSTVNIMDHQVWFNGEIIFLHERITNKKWLLALLILFWFTPASIRRKLLFSGLLLLANFTGSVIDVMFTSHIAVVAPDEYSAALVGNTPHLLMILGLLTAWIWRERKIFLQIFSRIKINPVFLEKKLPAIIIIIFIYALMSKFFLGIFQYTSWINFLFHSSAGILKLFNYPVYVESHNLIGENGSIYMAKSCLGLNTMMLFAAIVIITAKNTRIKWLYIVFGVIFLNIVNIIRFVLLFIHIQKHGDYVLSMDVHDMYNYVIYGIVFILWIFWFEKYSDIREVTKNEQDAPIQN